MCYPFLEISSNNAGSHLQQTLFFFTSFHPLVSQSQVRVLANSYELTNSFSCGCKLVHVVSRWVKHPKKLCVKLVHLKELTGTVPQKKLVKNEGTLLNET